MSTRATARHTRPKKLTPKQNVQIFREEQVESLLEIDAAIARGQIETGVEKAEESEYHLQQVIKASQALKDETNLKDAYIPTPPTIASNVQYDVLYPKGFQKPATYIRSSATVEDCQGVAYDMDEEDEVALKKINSSLPSNLSPCSEDQFEEVMFFFEEAAQTKQPYSAVDSPPVLPLEEIEDQYDHAVPPHVKMYAKFIYEHWYARRFATGNRGLGNSLKYETGAETDEVDPYVCFRRRELRQVRKTRNRDAQSAEKLRMLRVQLETARTILGMVKAREHMRKQQLDLDRQLFEQRHLFKQTKRKLGEKGDDDLLVNQKKQKVQQAVDPAQAALAQQLRIPVSGGHASELRTLEDVRAEKERSIENEISLNEEKHNRWNEGFVDKTKAPLAPIPNRSNIEPSAQFLEAIPAVVYLPTPPASISEDEAQNDTEKPDIEMKDARESRSSTPAFRYASPIDDDSGPALPSFRRRVGRGGRILIDRKMPFRSREKDERFRFDESDDDMDDSFGTDEDDDFARATHRSYLLNRSSSIASTTASIDALAQSARRTQIENGQLSRSPNQPGHQIQPQPVTSGTS